jgi:nucleoside-diphosphate-sugar epimerase
MEQRSGTPRGGSRTERKRVRVVGASRRLGRHLVRLSLERAYDVLAVCRGQSVRKLADLAGRITIVPGATDPNVIARAVTSCDAARCRLFAPLKSLKRRPK